MDAPSSQEGGPARRLAGCAGAAWLLSAGSALLLVLTGLPDRLGLTDAWVAGLAYLLVSLAAFAFLLLLGALLLLIFGGPRVPKDS